MRPNGPFGAAGVGELPLTSPHVAVINAIYNATGVRIRHLPAYPEKVLAGLKASRLICSPPDALFQGKAIYLPSPGFLVAEIR